jgi:O-antigen/teichoic acid export membrane protein
MLTTSLVNVSLRGITVVSRFALIVYLARYVAPEELGVWGLVAVTIAISLYFQGLDFYMYNSRELLAAEPGKRPQLIRDQAALHGMAYIIVLPALTIVFASGTIDWRYAGWFYLLVIVEHLAQESVRLLFTLSRPTLANTVTLLRSGLWILVAVGLSYVLPSLRHLWFFWMCWAAGAAVGVGLTAYALRGLPWRDALAAKVDWRWIRGGLRVSLPFMMATLSFLLIQYADRYFLQHFWGEAKVGIYTFFAGIANVVHVFVLTGVVTILYPRLIESYQKSKLDDYAFNMRRLIIGTLIAIVILGSGVVLFIHPVLGLVRKVLYEEHVGVLYIMLATASLLCLSYIPHYALFVRMQDRTIIRSTVAALVVALFANIMLVPAYGVKGAATATLSGVTAMAIIKPIAALRVRRFERRRQIGDRMTVMSGETLGSSQ